MHSLEVLAIAQYTIYSDSQAAIRHIQNRTLPHSLQKEVERAPSEDGGRLSLRRTIKEAYLQLRLDKRLYPLPHPSLTVPEARLLRHDDDDGSPNDEEHIEKTTQAEDPADPIQCAAIMNAVTETFVCDTNAADDHHLLEGGSHYLAIAPREGQIPISLLYDEHAVELSFPQIYLDQLTELLERLRVNGDISQCRSVQDMPSLDRIELWNNDPVACAIHVNPLFDVIRRDIAVDYFKRAEFEQRGSPHVHVLLWFDNAPDEELNMTMPKTIDMIDFVVSLDTSFLRSRPPFHINVKQPSNLHFGFLQGIPLDSGCEHLSITTDFNPGGHAERQPPPPLVDIEGQRL
ncbi:hypothetical protein HPB49_011122 [Dermacentor silvarum]|uniref:Uncharacterized protein n=1 Tax=Dermacentor silvarum TaxID=543639 RepID=A0ACB8C915_DERSI|nr:hypothetical protein HPB49_011122 [Dermacentor silvarum]